MESGGVSWFGSFIVCSLHAALNKTQVLPEPKIASAYDFSRDSKLLKEPYVALISRSREPLGLVPLFRSYC